MNLNDAALFVKVVQKGSFTAAGGALGIRVSTVSRRVARLEAELGIRLLHRTTRKLSLTDAGRTYLRMVTTGLEHLDAAAAAIRDLQSEPSGHIRFTSVPGMGRFAWELIERFLVENPRVSIDMDLTEHTVDLVGGGYDLALRTGALGDSSLISKRVADSHFALFAAPEYLDKGAAIETPDDLADHNCILFGTSVDGATWSLSSGRRRAQVPVSGRLMTTSLETIHYACSAGFGVAHLPIELCQPLVQAGRLVRVLPDWAGAVFGVFLVYPSRRHVSPTVRAFIDFLEVEVKVSLPRSLAHHVPTAPQPTASASTGARDG